MFSIIQLLFVSSFAQKIAQYFIQPQDKYNVLAFQDFITSDFRQDTKILISIEFNDINDLPILFICHGQLEMNENLEKTLYDNSLCVFDSYSLTKLGYQQSLQVIRDESLKIISPAQNLLVSPQNNITVVIKHSQNLQTYSLQFARIPYQQSIKNCQSGNNFMGFCKCQGQIMGIDCNIKIDPLPQQIVRLDAQKQYFLNLSDFGEDQELKLNLENSTSYQYICYFRDRQPIQIESTQTLQISSQYVQECKQFTKQLSYIITFQVDAFIVLSVNTNIKVAQEALSTNNTVVIILSTTIPSLMGLICIQYLIYKYRSMKNETKSDNQKIQIQIDKREDLQGELNVCSICLDTLVDKNQTKTKIKLITRIQCGHAFHKKCLNGWIKNYQNNCPLCRADVLNKEENIVSIQTQKVKTIQNFNNLSNL